MLNISLIADQPEPFKQMKDERQYHADNRCQSHSFKLNIAELHSSSTYTDNEHDCCKREVDRLGVVNLGLDQHANPRSSNDTKEQNTDSLP